MRSRSLLQTKTNQLITLLYTVLKDTLLHWIYGNIVNELGSKVLLLLVPVSPVMADSSAVSSEASRTIPSAGTSMPSTRSMTSPTMTND